SNPPQAQEAWDQWFTPLFNTIHDNPDVVKAVSYINCYWKSHLMWVNNPTFQDIDARLHLNNDLAQKWRNETSKSTYLKASPSLFPTLNGSIKD
ncbi:MAG: endo-1,3-beta-xylanase, partial [Bacteroidota bacterium]